MTISAEIILDSLHPNGKDRITTMRVTYGRVVHAEALRHRMFSMNASSSRAIPFKKFAKWVGEDPYMFVEWGKNQPGMAAKALLSEDDTRVCKMLWLRARDQVLEIATQMEEVGLHKQCLNRLVEPWHHITVIQTGNAAAYANFFALRCHPDAQPDIREMACAQLRAYHASTPRQLEWGQWHTPFVSDTEAANLFPEDACRISAARCARTSYLTFDGENPDPVKDMALYEKLVSGVVHASPLEHQARAMHKTDETPKGGNLGPSWVQFRKTIPNEAATEIPAYAYEMAGIQR